MTSKPRSWKRVAIWVAIALSESVTLMKTVPSVGSSTPAAAWALAKAVGKSAAIPITSPVLFISGPSIASAPAKRANGSTASLTLTWPMWSPGSSRSATFSPSISRHASFASGAPIAFETNGHGARGARVRLDHEELAVVDRVLDVDQADHAELQRDPLGRLADLVLHVLAEAHRRDHAGRVAGVDPGLLDVLHHRGDEALVAVAERVDVDLDRVLEEAVEQQRVLLVGLDVRVEVGRERLARVTDLHRPAAEHVARADQQREADVARRSRPPPRPRGRCRMEGA